MNRDAPEFVAQVPQCRLGGRRRILRRGSSGHGSRRGCTHLQLPTFAENSLELSATIYPKSLEMAPALSLPLPCSCTGTLWFPLLCTPCGICHPLVPGLPAPQPTGLKQSNLLRIQLLRVQPHRIHPKASSGQNCREQNFYPQILFQKICSTDS